MIFSALEETDSLILSMLSYYDLEAVNLLNRKTVKIFNREGFWLDMIRTKYPELVITEAMIYHKKLYLHLGQCSVRGLLDYAMLNDCPEICQFMVSKNKPIFTSGANLLAKHGKLSILKQSEYLPDNVGLANAIQNCHFDVTQWLLYERKLNINYSWLINNLKFETIKYLCDIDKSRVVNLAQFKCEFARYGQLDILKLLKKHGIFVNSGELNIAAEQGHYNIITWAAKDNIYPDRNGCNLALFGKYYNIVEFLIQNHIKPTAFAFGQLLRENRMEDVKLLLEQDLIPRDDHIDCANKKGLDKIIELFIIYGHITERFPTKLFLIEELFDLYNL